MFLSERMGCNYVNAEGICKIDLIISQAVSKDTGLT